MKRLLKIVFLLLLLVLVLSRCGFLSVQKEPEATAAATEDPVARNDYQWSDLNRSGSLYAYADDTYTSSVGVDVSYHQGQIDWQKVKASGISFAMIRVGYRGYESGLINEDDYFLTNMKNASAAGLDLGVYFFSQAVSTAEAEEEARYVLKQIQNYQIVCPVVFDMETASDHDRIADLSRLERTEIAAAFCRVIQQAGYVPMVYGSTSWLQDEIRMQDLAEYQFWVASYQETPDFPYVFSMWQYSSKAVVDGISVNVDLNLWLQKKN